MMRQKTPIFRGWDWLILLRVFSLHTCHQFHRVTTHLSLETEYHTMDFYCKSTLSCKIFFCELQWTIKRQKISSPQDELSKMVWYYKIHGVYDDKESLMRAKELRNCEVDNGDKQLLLDT
jgi:hypothetical protein